MKDEDVRGLFQRSHVVVIHEQKRREKDYEGDEIQSPCVSLRRVGEQTPSGDQTIDEEEVRGLPFFDDLRT